MLIGVTCATRNTSAERDQDGSATDHERHPRRDHAAEHEQQRDGGERQGDELAALQVRLGNLLDVAVERGAAGKVHADPGHRA